MSKALQEAMDMASYEVFLDERRTYLLERIAAAAKVSGRDPEDVVCEAVSKTVDCEAFAAAYRVGWRAFAENRPQELTRKCEFAQARPELKSARFDMIGNLQTNKINQVLGKATLIHSISSLHLAKAVSSRALRQNLNAAALIEVNILGEETKSGFSPHKLLEDLDTLLQLPGIQIAGLMTMAPAANPDAARRSFSGLRELKALLQTRSDLTWDTLSCGMSDDFEIAIEEGSTLVRLGRIVFNPAYELDAQKR